MIELTPIEENPVDRLTAERTARCVARFLGIEPPPLIFFFPEDGERDLMGKYKGGRIYLNCRQSELEIEDTTAHELRHCWQEISGKHKVNAQSRERDSWIFEREWRELCNR